MRLGEGHDRIPDARAEPRAQPRLGQTISTGGSRGIRESHDYVRKGGAAAREMLVQAAADEWKVPASECTAANERHHARAVGPHDDLRQGGRGGRQARRRRRTSSSRTRRTGRSPASRSQRLDTADKLTGKQVYGIDLKLPGMLNAAIKDCPVFGGKVEELRRRQGPEHARRASSVVQVGDSAVAVVADTWWRAKTALDALPIDWDEGPNAKRLERRHRRLAEGGPRRQGGASSATRSATRAARIASAAKKVEAVYAYPYQNHATMEPMNATALLDARRCEVWTPTQNGEAALAADRRGFRPADRRMRRVTRSTSAAASAGAAPSTTTSARR